MGKEKKRKDRKIWMAALFAAYGVCMMWLLFGRRLGNSIYPQQMADGINLKPLATVRRYIALLRSSEGYLVRHAFVNLAGNVMMFIPLGYFLPGVFPGMRSFWKTVILSAAMIAAVETVQYFTFLGSCDVDDFILNMAGIILGYLFYKFTARTS